MAMMGEAVLSFVRLKFEVALAFQLVEQSGAFLSVVVNVRQGRVASSSARDSLRFTILLS